jgi:hypothetical protein
MVLIMNINLISLHIYRLNESGPRPLAKGWDQTRLNAEVGRLGCVSVTVLTLNEMWDFSK